MKIAVLSDGGWGTALALLLVRNGHEVTQWGAFPAYLREMTERGENFKFLPGVPLDRRLRHEPDIAQATAGADLILLATPTQYLRGVLEQFKPHFRRGSQIVLNVAKGIENETDLRISEMVREELGDTTYVQLSGPSHAEEVARLVPTAVVAASRDAEAAKRVQSWFCNEVFRVYTSDDVIGVELGGALKNVMAIAAGICDGMVLGDNPKAALMTRGNAEMARLGAALGGNPRTFNGLSGIGDLIVTCTSGHSRNRHVGEELGRGKKLPEILHAMGMVVAEGVPTTRGAYRLARKAGVETPLLDQIHEILHDGKDLARAIRDLMTRPLKEE